MDLLVVADDLTGANDTGAAFAQRGFRTAIRRTDSEPFEVDWPESVEVGVVDTDSRYRDPAEAARRVGGVVERFREVPVYLKVDSTLRGNLVASIDAAMDAKGASLGVVAPAFPAEGRQTVGGYHLVDGVPVAETDIAADHEAPVSSSLPTLLSRSSYPITQVSLDDVGKQSDDGPDTPTDTDSREQTAPEGSVDSLAATFSAHAGADHSPVLVCDATGPGHLDAIASAITGVAERVLYVGSAGLARHVRLRPGADVLGVVGSVASETLSQLQRVPRDSVVKLDPEAAIRDPASAVERAVDRATTRLTGGGMAVITAATDRSDVETTLQTGADIGQTEQNTRMRIESTLSTAAANTIRQANPSGLFLTGGAVSAATLSAIDAEGVTLSGRMVDDGIPLGFVDGGDAAETPIVTKAGGFGPETAIVNALRFLATYCDPEASRRNHDG